MCCRTSTLAFHQQHFLDEDAFLTVFEKRMGIDPSSYPKILVSSSSYKIL